MRNMLFCALALFTLLLHSSCHKKEAPSTVLLSSDYLIYGYGGGFTSPNATSSYFLITPTEYRKDTNVLTQGVPRASTDFKFTCLLSAAQFAEVAYLRNSIPSELFQLNGAHIGEYWPDAGYLEVRMANGGKEYVWYFEAEQRNSSAVIKDFVRQLQLHM